MVPVMGSHRGVSLTIERGPHRGIVRTEILRRINAMIDELQLDNVEVSFLLTDDDRIHELNKVYRHKDKPTDVLAFALREGDFAELAGNALGDVIVSVPTARKQAEERDRHVLEEVTMLAAHGLLHLLGWDHDTPAKDRRMTAETDRLCRAAAPRSPRASTAPSKGGAQTKKPQSSRSTKKRRSSKG